MSKSNTESDTFNSNPVDTARELAEREMDLNCQESCKILNSEQQRRVAAIEILFWMGFISKANNKPIESSCIDWARARYLENACKISAIEDPVDREAKIRAVVECCQKAGQKAATTSPTNGEISQGIFEAACKKIEKAVDVQRACLCENCT